MTPAQRILYASSWQDQATEAGFYYTASNPTPGTGLATIAALASLADTSPFVQINTGVDTYWLDYARFTCTAPGTAGASIRFAVQTYAAVKAAPTGGTLLSLNNARSDVAAASTASVWAGPLVAAAGTPRYVSGSLIRPVIPVVGDIYIVKFGSQAFDVVEALTPSGTAITVATIPAPRVDLGPNTTGQLHIWLPSQSGASNWEVEVGLAKMTD